MTLAVTEEFHEMVLEWDMDDNDTFLTICGMKDVKVERTANVDTTETPHCDDESLPFGTSRAVRSIEVKVSGTAVWAQSSAGGLMTWFYSAGQKNIRIRHTKASVGDIETEAGACIITTLSDARTKGKTVERDLMIEFNGTPTTTVKSA